MVEQVLHDGKVIGTIDGSVYHKICMPEHFMGIFHGFDISVSVIDMLKKKNVFEVHIEYRGKRGTLFYVVPLTSYINSTKIFMFNGVDEQKFVDTRCMREIKSGA